MATNGRSPKIGVALSGGGPSGIAHIGVLKAFVKNNIPIDIISGTSAGAIIAALFAQGYTPWQMEEITKGLKFFDFIDLKITLPEMIKYSAKSFFGNRLRSWSSLPSGLIKGDKIEKFLKSLWGEQTIQQTKIPLAITSVDVISGDTVFFITPIPGQRGILNARYYHNVLLTEAVRSSIAIPGIFLPKKFRGMTLVDGAVKNNLPTDILNYMGADIIIGIDLGYAGKANYNINSVSEILLQCINIMNREVTLLKSQQHANLIIRPVLTDSPFQDQKQTLSCINAGEAAVLECLTEIKNLM
ncbi:MAG: patatin-like phospholipase family protein [Pelosinus sp.]|nr:patatin-like phospholipase family protein [Pelosinus sp.]